MIKKLSQKYIATTIVCAGFILLVLCPIQNFGFEPFEKDTTKVRSRFKIGGIPVLSYDADLGLKYGAVVNLFDYGDSKYPPNFEQYLMLRLTNTTGGTANLQALLESESLIKNAKVLAEASYIIDKKLDFFGFKSRILCTRKKIFTNAIRCSTLFAGKQIKIVDRIYIQLF